MNHRWLRASAVLVTALICIAGKSESGQLTYARGQNVVAAFEGWERHADGTFAMVFSYYNRNYEETLDIPIGPENNIEPGGPDQGQPTHFLPGRHRFVFSVKVPKDFGDQTLLWSLAAHGQTQKVVGTLKPVWQIDRRRTTRGGNDDAIDSNTPPVASIQPAEQSIASGARATLAISATDDGLPKRIRTSFPAPNGAGIPPQLYAVPPSTAPQRGGAGGRAGGAGGRGEAAGAEGGSLSYEWFKYRGPGKVTFIEPRGILADGKATSIASFSEPGDYVLQMIVDDGSGESAGNFGYHCCWTNVEVKVHVTGAAPATRR